MSEYIVRETDYGLATKQEIVGELVRCKDCRWQGDDEHCPVCNCCGREELPNGEWYCADGERKTDVAD